MEEGCSRGSCLSRHDQDDPEGWPGGGRVPGAGFPQRYHCPGPQHPQETRQAHLLRVCSALWPLLYFK